MQTEAKFCQRLRANDRGCGRKHCNLPHLMAEPMIHRWLQRIGSSGHIRNFTPRSVRD